MANITLTESEIEGIVFEDSEDYRVVSERDIDSFRWSVLVESIVKSEKTGKLYRIMWQRAATEHQEHSFNDTTLVEVVEKVRIIEKKYYETVSD